MKNIEEVINNGYRIVLEKILKEEHSIERMLSFMQMHGSSADLNFGEDNMCWECSFITSGQRFTGISKMPRLAIIECLKKTLK